MRAMAPARLCPVKPSQGKKGGKQAEQKQPSMRKEGSSHSDPCLLARQPDAAPWLTVVMKNWEPLVSGPALAMLSTPGLVWRSLKFSSCTWQAQMHGHHASSCPRL
jgi:hypothetical protein